MSELREKLLDWMTESGNNLQFLLDEFGKQLVYPYSLSLSMMVRENVQLKDALSLMEERADNYLLKAALKLRKTIQEHDVTAPC